jgi:hypothetical protein
VVFAEILQVRSDRLLKKLTRVCKLALVVEDRRQVGVPDGDVWVVFAEILDTRGQCLLVQLARLRKLALVFENLSSSARSQ